MTLRDFCDDAWFALWQWWHDLRVALGFRYVSTSLRFRGRTWIFTTVRPPPLKILLSRAVWEKKIADAEKARLEWRAKARRS